MIQGRICPYATPSVRRLRDLRFSVRQGHPIRQWKGLGLGVQPISINIVTTPSGYSQEHDKWSSSSCLHVSGIIETSQFETLDSTSLIVKFPPHRYPSSPSTRSSSLIRVACPSDKEGYYCQPTYTGHTGIMTNHLSQLASQVPGFINEHSKRRHDPTTLDLSQYFDFSRFYEGEPSSPGDPSRSDASSDPGLTSGPSEEDGAPSPSPSFSTLHLKDAVKQVKQQDDRFTVPEREIRPKGGLPYPSNLHLDNPPSPNRPSSAGNNDMLLSSPGSPILLDALPGDSPLFNRGRRTRPLDNPDKVAEMRKIGACYRCKVRKVPCDQGDTCSTCIHDAKRMSNDECDDLARQICFRDQFQKHVFPKMSFLLAEKPERCTSHNSNPIFSTFRLFFESSTAYPPPCLEVQVKKVASQQRCDTPATQLAVQPHYEEILQWVSAQMKQEGDADLQSALDNLVAYCAEQGRHELPHSDLAHSVHELRCMHKVWRQKRFLYRRQPGCIVEEIPREIHQALSVIATMRMKHLEATVLRLLHKKTAKLPSERERLPLWACMMQLILLYRDILSLAESQASWADHENILSVFNTLVVVCDSLFAKKKPVLTAIDLNTKPHLAALFYAAASRQSDFYEMISRRHTDFDRLLKALLAQPSRGATQAKAHPQKRVKRCS
ncbi:hypothetical protein F5Y19DRAFT_80007 [Xylariaceae sp. FL1651]|nr:hypothetical protein F5Y19DRAFT_80007 [Xylariaceae sp. FL1651]